MCVKRIASPPKDEIGSSNASTSFHEDEKRGSDDERESGQMIPANRLAEVRNGEGDENKKRQYLLDRFQLGR